MTTARFLPRLGQRAVVLGASMAGLLAARVLGDRFDEVVLLERDALPDAAVLRKGTPHVAHAHGLLARGRMVLEEFFPGLTEALCAQGALSGDLGQDVPFIAGTHRFASAHAGLRGIAASRPTLEAELRRRLRAQRGVRMLCEVDVQAPEVDATAQRVTSARFTQRAGGAEETLAADLVVDCTGRGSRCPAWLARWGYAPAEEEQVQVGISYVTAYFQREAQHAPGISAIICSARPDTPRPGVMIAQEPAEPGGPARWVVTLGGYAGDPLEPSLEAMRARAQRMGSPEIVRVLHESSLLGEPIPYRFAHSQRRRYERLARFPQRLLVLGDALAAFNPIFGQGMTVAACEALALRDALAREGLGAGLAPSFFRAAARAIDVPWQIAVGADLAIDSVPGPRPAKVRFINAYLARLFRAAEHDAKVAIAFKKVAHLIAAPPSLFAPGIVARVLWGAPRSQRASVSSIALNTTTERR